MCKSKLEKSRKCFLKMPEVFLCIDKIELYKEYRY